MIDVLARGCPSWTPVKGWQDLGGCWTPGPAPSWSTPLHIALAALIAAGTIGLIADLHHRLAIRRPRS
jgi:hypothetical protein